MARAAMVEVEDLDVFQMPTPTVGDNVYNSGDGVYFTEHPGRPATIGLYNLSASTTATVTFTAAPGAPGGPADKTIAFNGAASVLLIPPGWLPQHLYRRDDGQETDPGRIYIDASHDLVMACVVRGPAGYPRSRGASAGPALSSARTLVTPQIVAPLGTIAVGAIMTDTDGLAYYPSGSEALMAVRGAGVQTLTITANPNNKYGRTAAFTVTQANANEMIVMPPGVLPLDIIRRAHSTDPGVVYFSSDQAASARYALVGLRP